METELIERARSGDQSAFEELVEPYRRELQVHAYRMLGSAADAEDALQETMLAAWQGLGSFEQRASVRTWLYRIATTRTLNMLRAAGRRPRVEATPLAVEPPEPTRLGEVMWLEPYPDVLLADPEIGPEARYESRGRIVGKRQSDRGHSSKMAEPNGGVKWIWDSLTHVCSWWEAHAAWAAPPRRRLPEKAPAWRCSPVPVRRSMRRSPT